MEKAMQQKLYNALWDLRHQYPGVLTRQDTDLVLRFIKVLMGEWKVEGFVKEAVGMVADATFQRFTLENHGRLTTGDLQTLAVYTKLLKEKLGVDRSDGPWSVTRTPEVPRCPKK